MARITIKLMMLSLIISLAVITVTYVLQCNQVYQSSPVTNSNEDYLIKRNSKYYEEIGCSINGLYEISCRKEEKEVFIPFSFLSKYYEVYGKLTQAKGKEKFEWSHSYSKVFKPTAKYDPSGAFMYFSNYNVEVRDRVKCISATEGVPVSTQWEASGYYYPVQVAQFGLSHYSKNLTETRPKLRNLQDINNSTAEWSVSLGASISRKYESAVKSWVVEFNARGESSVTLKLKPGSELVLNANLLFRDKNGSLSVLLEDKERFQLFSVSFVCSPELITVSTSNNGDGSNFTVYYGLGSCEDWSVLTRDLYVDLLKGNVLLGRGKKLSRSKLKVLSITLKGRGLLGGLAISSSNHVDMFYSSADWLVRHQDSHGGWPIGVRRKMASGRVDLNPGWYSAMGQGQAMSLLMRAFYRSGKTRYLEAALNGMKPFSISSSEGGVRAYFMNQYPWYEEYPTIPPSFVLNGFIYSLIGLYDVLTLAPEDRSSDARLLFDQGMHSLKKLLPLFDTGSGTVYDLRHFTLGLSPNLARWDYHATHVNQLLLLSTIDRDPILTTIAERWLNYMQGKRAAHN